MAGEGKLCARREDPDRALGSVVDEDRLRESEVERDGLTTLRRNGGTVEEDPERVAPAAIGADEDPQDVEDGHDRVPSLVRPAVVRSSAIRCRPMIVIASVIRPSAAIASASSNGTQRIARSSLGS